MTTVLSAALTTTTRLPGLTACGGRERQGHARPWVPPAAAAAAAAAPAPALRQPHLGEAGLGASPARSDGTCQRGSRGGWARRWAGAGLGPLPGADRAPIVGPKHEAAKRFGSLSRAGRADADLAGAEVRMVAILATVLRLDRDKAACNCGGAGASMRPAELDLTWNETSSPPSTARATVLNNHARSIQRPTLAGGGALAPAAEELAIAIAPPGLR
jgi:hypothetical protein